MLCSLTANCSQRGRACWHRHLNVDHTVEIMNICERSCTNIELAHPKRDFSGEKSCVLVFGFFSIFTLENGEDRSAL